MESDSEAIDFRVASGLFAIVHKSINANKYKSLGLMVVHRVAVF